MNRVPAAALFGVFAACTWSHGPHTVAEPTPPGACGLDEKIDVACAERRSPSGRCPAVATGLTTPFTKSATGRYDERRTQEVLANLRDARGKPVYASLAAELDRQIASFCCYAACSKIAVADHCVSAYACGADPRQVPLTYVFCLDEHSGRTSAPAARPYEECPAAIAPMGAGMPAGFDRGGVFAPGVTADYRARYGPAHRCCYRTYTHAGEFYQ